MSDPITFIEVSPVREKPFVLTDIFDMGIRGLKTLTAVEVGTVAEDAYVAIDYRYEQQQAFVTSAYRRLYKNGVATFPVTAVEFRARIRFKNQDDIDLSYILIRWKMSDKRTVRGTYATSTKAISGTGE